MPLPIEPFKVFISHATYPDSQLVNWMADALDRIHIRAFVYERYQMGGQNRFNKIKDMIQTCPWFLVLLTKDGIASQWVNQEIGYAVATGKDPIPIIEADSTGKRLQSSGFIELHDPISYSKGNEIGLMAQVIYALKNYVQWAQTWQDLIFLRCICGNEFDGQLEFHNNWDRYVTNLPYTPFPITWNCPKCERQMSVSFPDCHLLPQTNP
jgi:hypothetical protein